LTDGSGATQAGAVFYTAWRMGLGDPADPCLRPTPISIFGKQQRNLAAPGEGLLQKTFWRQEANLWHEVASNDLQSPFKVGGWAIFFSPVPRQT
jgi:hypothetical protein